MPRILPSQAVAAIDRMFAFLANPGADPGLGAAEAPAIAATIALLAEIPAELITLDGANYGVIVEKRARMSAFVETTTVRGHHANTLNGRHVRELRNLIGQCPDHAIPVNVQTLAFVADQQLRESLRADIASVESSIKDADWKAATVIAGSVVEALLLDALLKEQANDIAAAVAALVAQGTFRQ